MNLHTHVTFSELKLVKAIWRLNDAVQNGRIDAPIGNRGVRPSIRNDAPDEEWFDWLWQEVSRMAKTYDKGLGANFPWSPISVYCMTQRMRKCPNTGANRVALVAVKKGQSCCQSCGCCGDEKVCTDHHVPSNQNGADDIRNWQLLCQGCNSRKSDGLDGILKSKTKPANVGFGLFH